MLGSKKPNYEKPASIISKDTTIESTLIQSKSSLQINGAMVGNLEIGDSLVIGEGGSVKGHVTADFLLVAGQIDGNIEAKQQLQLMKSAVINGDVVCGSIIIDEGAVLNGALRMEEKATSSKTKLFGKPKELPNPKAKALPKNS